MSSEGDPSAEARSLTNEEAGQLLAAPVVAHFGAIEEGSPPHFTKVRFVWDGHVVVMAALEHHQRLAGVHDGQPAGLLIEVEDPPDPSGGGVRVRQLRGSGRAGLVMDGDGAWTRRIAAKYDTGAGAAAVVEVRSGRPRVVIRLVPTRWRGFAAVRPTL